MEIVGYCLLFYLLFGLALAVFAVVFDEDVREHEVYRDPTFWSHALICWPMIIGYMMYYWYTEED